MFESEPTINLTITSHHRAHHRRLTGAPASLSGIISVAGDTGFTPSAPTDPDAGDSITFSTDDNRFRAIN